MGYYTTASDWASTVIGQYNLSGSSATSSESFFTAVPAFVIGNGSDYSNKSDAFKVLFNGDTTVSNDLMVGGDVEVSSDATLKANIISLGATLSKLLLIDLCQLLIQKTKISRQKRIEYKGGGCSSFKDGRYFCNQNI
ncbi:hypothetical protein OA501_02745 [Flavobacteriaceae bacterium]|nr:hypothetical protein [Flavobacteriaceae bacterium]